MRVDEVIAEITQRCRNRLLLEDIDKLYDFKTVVEELLEENI